MIDCNSLLSFYLRFILKVIAKETVDIKGVGFYSLGSARKNLSEEQKIQYFELFENYFLKTTSLNNPDIQLLPVNMDQPNHGIWFMIHF